MTMKENERIKETLGVFREGKYDHLFEVWPYNLLLDMHKSEQRALNIDLELFDALISDSIVLSDIERYLIISKYYFGESDVDIAKTLITVFVMDTLSELFEVDTQGMKGIGLDHNMISTRIQKILSKIKVHSEIIGCSIETKVRKYKKYSEERYNELRHSINTRVLELNEKIQELKNTMNTIYGRSAVLQLKIWNYEHPEVVENPRELNASYDICIEDLRDRISIRIINALAAAGFNTIGDLAQSSKAELRKVKGIGAESVIDLIKVMNEYGVNIPDQNF